MLVGAAKEGPLPGAMAHGGSSPATAPAWREQLDVCRLSSWRHSSRMPTSSVLGPRADDRGRQDARHAVRRMCRGCGGGRRAAAAATQSLEGTPCSGVAPPPRPVAPPGSAWRPHRVAVGRHTPQARSVAEQHQRLCRVLAAAVSSPASCLAGPRFVGRGPRGDTTSGWLSALGNQGTQAEWVASVRDHLAWSWVAFHATFHRHMHRHEVCGTQLRCLCARVCLIGARGARLGR